jgi:two-component system, LytTR family, response regulator
MIRIGVVDDEENARRVVLKYLERHCPAYTIVFEASDYQETVDLTLKHEPDLLFLDIHLLEGTGIEVAQELKGKTKAKIIFTTAYNEYAINALRLQAFDYLLKPLDAAEFIDALARVQQIIDTEKSLDSKTCTIRFTTLQGIELLDCKKVLFIKAEASYCSIHTEDGKSVLISKPLKFVEQQIEKNPSFLKIHKSYIANSNFIQSIDRGNQEVVLMDGSKLPISRSKMKEVLTAFKTF